MNIRILDSSGFAAYDKYVYAHTRATLYHLSGWRNIITKTYGHKSYYLTAVRDDGAIAGVLPLVHLKSILFGNSLISIPFFDTGGILSDDETAEKALLSEAINLGQKLNTDRIELRHIEPLITAVPNTVTHSHKVLMQLDLPGNADLLMKTFKAKLRSQVRKPLKEGLYSKIGGSELAENFYKVFLINMRDLGSPVHSKKLITSVLDEFPDHARILIIYKEKEPLACALIIGFRDILENPWASSLREYSHLSPNMLLYWAMLEYACNKGYARFDFGRSSPGQGTYKFKEQWGANPIPLNWHTIYLKGKPEQTETSGASKFDTAVRYWKKLPVSATKIIGPIIRKHIGL
ncbi:MAG: methicillin resistance protein [Desulfobacteraceae bacterium IS3]|nr:MAG: methicillin resistance protein [Desulfobacteraceae bacterium IS3]